MPWLLTVVLLFTFIPYLFLYNVITGQLAVIESE